MTKSEVKAYFTIFLLSIAVASCLDSNRDYDDTDSAATEKRSGMQLYTDHGTGCQYLSKYFGGLTPRINENGDHMGCYGENR